MADIRHMIQIAAPREAVYRLVSTARGFTQWWAADVTGDDKSAELGFFKRATVYGLKRTIDKPPVECVWSCETGKEWTGTRLIFVMESAGQNTNLQFTHADWALETDYFISCNTTWGELMFRLKAAAEGKPTGPLFLTDSLAY